MSFPIKITLIRENRLLLVTKNTLSSSTTTSTSFLVELEHNLNLITQAAQRQLDLRNSAQEFFKFIGIPKAHRPLATQWNWTVHENNKSKGSESLPSMITLVHYLKKYGKHCFPELFKEREAEGQAKVNATLDYLQKLSIQRLQQKVLMAPLPASSSLDPYLASSIFTTAPLSPKKPSKKRKQPSFVEDLQQKTNQPLPSLPKLIIKPRKSIQGLHQPLPPSPSSPYLAPKPLSVFLTEQSQTLKVRDEKTQKTKMTSTEIPAKRQKTSSQTSSVSDEKSSLSGTFSVTPSSSTTSYYKMPCIAIFSIEKQATSKIPIFHLCYTAKTSSIAEYKIWESMLTTTIHTYEHLKQILCTDKIKIRWKKLHGLHEKPIPIKTREEYLLKTLQGIRATLHHLKTKYSDKLTSTKGNEIRSLLAKSIALLKKALEKTSIPLLDEQLKESISKHILDNPCLFLEKLEMLKQEELHQNTPTYPASVSLKTSVLPSHLPPISLLTTEEKDIMASDDENNSFLEAPLPSAVAIQSHITSPIEPSKTKAVAIFAITSTAYTTTPSFNLYYFAKWHKGSACRLSLTIVDSIIQTCKHLYTIIKNPHVKVKWKEDIGSQPSERVFISREKYLLKILQGLRAMQQHLNKHHASMLTLKRNIDPLPFLKNAITVLKNTLKDEKIDVPSTKTHVKELISDYIPKTPRHYLKILEACKKEELVKIEEAKTFLLDTSISKPITLLSTDEKNIIASDEEEELPSTSEMITSSTSAQKTRSIIQPITIFAIEFHHYGPASCYHLNYTTRTSNVSNYFVAKSILLSLVVTYKNLQKILDSKKIKVKWSKSRSIHQKAKPIRCKKEYYSKILQGLKATQHHLETKHPHILSSSLGNKIQATLNDSIDLLTQDEETSTTPNEQDLLAENISKYTPKPPLLLLEELECLKKKALILKAELHKKARTSTTTVSPASMK